MLERKTSNWGMFTAICCGVASFFAMQTIYPAGEKTTDNIAIMYEVSDIPNIHNANIEAIQTALNEQIAIADVMPAAGEDMAEAADGGNTQDMNIKAPNSVDADNPLYSVRAIGAEDAPVVIEEFSSMTCPHCATFHVETLPALKEQYIDTGIVRLIFRDYPLNTPALQASALARCMPEDQYYNFITILYDTQSEWATAENADKLLQTAKLAGMTDDELQNCMDNRDLVKHILSSMQEHSKGYEVQSTPTFIFNDGEARIKGARPLAEFETTIKRLLDQQDEGQAANEE